MQRTCAPAAAWKIRELELRVCHLVHLFAPTCARHEIGDSERQTKNLRSPLACSARLRILCGTTPLTHDLRHSPRRLVRCTDRCLGHPSAALQDSFEIVTKQIALRSNELLPGSAAHESVHSL